MRGKFLLSGGQSHGLEMAIHRTGGSTTDVQWLCEGDNFKQVSMLARGDAQLTIKPKSEPDTVIVVDRSTEPLYPTYMRQVMDVEFEGTGPRKYDVASNVRLWFHQNQGRLHISGHGIYDHLKSEHMLKDCLSLRDGEEILKKGFVTFRSFASCRAALLWKSVIKNKVGNLLVPYLHEEKAGELAIDWYLLDMNFEKRSWATPLFFTPTRTTKSSAS